LDISTSGLGIWDVKTWHEQRLWIVSIGIAHILECSLRLAPLTIRNVQYTLALPWVEVRSHFVDVREWLMQVAC
jgi:hypothetical protein